ncbi:hypothetical protein D1646_11095 [Pseudoflavonifractor sp. 60]|nr:hypothetical protein [Pseudoflavonifractor sp. 60]
MQIWNEDGQGSLFAHDGCAGRTCPAHSAQGPPRGRTSASSSRRSSELRTIPFMSLDLTPGHGNLLGESYWELVSPWPGGSSTLNTGPAPLSEEDVFSLSQILQDAPPRKYYLSKTACLGILRRAGERGKELPPQLKAALMAQAGLIPLAAPASEPIAFAANQRDEVRDLHDVAGALGAQPGMKQQTFIAQDCLTPWDTQQARIFTPESKAPTLASADGGGGRNPGGLLFTAGVAGSLTPWDNQQRRISTPYGVAPTINSGELKPGGLLFVAGFCAGAAPSAGGIGYQEEIAPTLKATASGNMMPSILCLTGHGGQRMDITTDMTPTLRAQMGVHLPLICLNDQGGGIMSCSEDVAGTLRAQEHGHQPLVMGVQLFENHGIDARYTGPHKVSPTLTNRGGTGGNNLPLALQVREPICISGNAIDRQPQNGGNGLGCQEGIAYTLTATDHHAVFSRQRVDVFRDDNVASTESARQHKDATDLVLQNTGDERPLLIRRLTPLECERLQGFPDFWTDLPGASDSSRYKALGNSVAIPCVEYIMRGIAMAIISTK